MGDPFEQAWLLLKMPVVEPIPGVRMAHGFDEPVRDLHEYHQMKGRWKEGPDLMGTTNYQRDAEIQYMTPNEYFDRLAEVGVGRRMSSEKFTPRPHEDTLLAQPPQIQSQFPENLRTQEGMRWMGMKFPVGEGPKMVDRIVEGIKQGKVMGAPEMEMADGVPTGFQEGGHRMDALRMMGHGDTPVPVALTQPF